MSDARPAVFEPEPRPTLHDAFAARVAAHPDAEALRLVSPRDLRPFAVTWRMLDTRARALAAGLAAVGASDGGRLPPAARVAILATTRLEWVLVDIACVMAGLISVPLFPNVEPETLKRVLAASDAQLVIAENPWQAKKLLDVRAALPSTPRLVLMDEKMTLASGAEATLDELGPMGAPPVMLAEIERRGEGHEPSPDEERNEPEACWTICYTPGTEGKPKGVMWTHDNVLAAIGGLGGALPRPERPGREPEVVLVGMPLAQALARLMLWSGIAGPASGGGAGGDGGEPPPVVTALARADELVFEDARVLRPSVVVAVPSLFERAKSKVVGELRQSGAIAAMVSRWAEEKHDPKLEPTLGARLRSGIAARVVKPALARKLGGRVRLYISGGAPLSEAVQRFYGRHGIELREAYGMVETAAMTHLDHEAPMTPGSVGRALAGVEHRLGPDGELIVRGAMVSPGYWRDPGETAKVFDAAGWFFTGDLARVDDAGRLFITGRKRDIIVLSNGRTLAPRPVEEALCEEPLVAQAFVHGERRDFATALIALEREELERMARDAGLGTLEFEALSRHPEVHARIGALVHKVNQQLPPHAAIKKYAVLPSELSAEPGVLSPTYTPRRTQIAERFRDLIDSFYAESF